MLSDKDLTLSALFLAVMGMEIFLIYRRLGRSVKWVGDDAAFSFFLVFCLETARLVCYRSVDALSVMAVSLAVCLVWLFVGRKKSGGEDGG